VKAAKYFISAHPFWTVALFALIFPVVIAFVYVCAFQTGKAYDWAFLQKQSIFQLILAATLPSVFFIYVLRPHGKKLFVLSILLSMVYAPVSVWGVVMSYFVITCKVFGACGFP